MSYVPKYLSESSSIKHVTVGVKLEGVATKKDLEGITHVDKLDIPKLGTYQQM